MWITDFLRLSLHRSLYEVSPDEAETLMAAENSPALQDELYAFGDLLVNEVLSRSAQLDAKATSLLGWSAAAMAAILVYARGWGQAEWPVRVLIGGSVLLALSACVQAGRALRLLQWEIPSEADWFKFKLFADPFRLQRYHLFSMLETHQHHDRQNARKAVHVEQSQWLLIAATVLVAILIIVQ
jgi:hypothetical protein